MKRYGVISIDWTYLTAASDEKDHLQICNNCYFLSGQIVYCLRQRCLSQELHFTFTILHVQ